MANWQSALAAGYFPSPETKAHDEFTVATEAVRESLQEKKDAIAAAVASSSFLEAHQLQQEKLVLEDRLSKLEGAGRVKSDVGKIMRPIKCRSPKVGSPIVRAAAAKPRRMTGKTLAMDSIQVIPLHLSKPLQKLCLRNGTLSGYKFPYTQPGTKVGLFFLRLRDSQDLAVGDSIHINAEGIIHDAPEGQRIDDIVARVMPM